MIALAHEGVPAAERDTAQAEQQATRATGAAPARASLAPPGSPAGPGTTTSFCTCLPSTSSSHPRLGEGQAPHLVLARLPRHRDPPAHLAVHLHGQLHEPPRARPPGRPPARPRARGPAPDAAGRAAPPSPRRRGARRGRGGGPGSRGPRGGRPRPAPAPTCASRRWISFASSMRAATAVFRWMRSSMSSVTRCDRLVDLAAERLRLGRQLGRASAPRGSGGQGLGVPVHEPPDAQEEAVRALDLARRSTPSRARAGAAKRM